MGQEGAGDAALSNADIAAAHPLAPRDQESIARELTENINEAEGLVSRKEKLTEREKGRLAQLIDNILKLLDELLEFVADKLDGLIDKAIGEFEYLKELKLGDEYAKAFKSAKDDIVGVVEKITGKLGGPDEKHDDPTIDAPDDTPFAAIGPDSAIAGDDGPHEDILGGSSKTQDAPPAPDAGDVYVDADWARNETPTPFVPYADLSEQERLRKLAFDPDENVRAMVANNGFGLDALVSDPSELVRYTAMQALHKTGLDIDEWIKANPDKCIYGYQPMRVFDKRAYTIDGAKNAQRARERVAPKHLRSVRQ